MKIFNTISKTILIAGTMALIFLFLNIQATNAASFFDTAFAKEDVKSPDLKARIKILNTIDKMTQSEIESLENKLDDLDLDGDWIIIKDKFLQDLSDLKSDNKAFDKKVNDSEITLEEIKWLAKELKDWRENIYAPKLNEITNMAFIFDEEAILKIAYERRDKVSADIAKLDNQNISIMSALKSLFSKADSRLNNSNDLKNIAKDKFFKSNETIIAITIQKMASTTEQDAISNDNGIIQIKNVIKETPEEVQNSIRNSLKDSIKELKSAYDTFFQMNDIIKKYL